jgi:hypothetical protein
LDYGIQMSVQVLLLTVGFVLVLWGLRIVKLYVATLGLLFGGAAGGIIATFSTGSDQAALAGVAIGGLAGMLIAWPLQKLLVILATACLGAVFAVTAVVAAAGADYVAPAAIGGFVAGAIAAAAHFDTIVIAATALTGSQFVFHAVFVPADTWMGTPREVALRMLGIYVDNIIGVAATTVLFVAFAWIYQRRLSRKRIADARYPERLITARRIPFRLASVIVATIAASSAFALAGFAPASSFELLGFHALSWPIVAWATARFLRPWPFTLTTHDDEDRPNHGWRTRRFASVVAFGLIVPPMLSAALFALYGLNPDAIVPFYRSFLFGDPATIVVKAALSLAVVPVLLTLAVPASVRRPARHAAEPITVVTDPDTDPEKAAAPEATDPPESTDEPTFAPGVA